MKKVVYIIPGFGYSPHHKEYVKLAEVFRKNGFKPKVVRINWYRRKMEDYVEQFMNQYQSSPEEEVTILGFSLGANVALLVSPMVKPKNIVFCSLSPYFKEDQTDMKDIKYKWHEKPLMLLTEVLVSPALKSMKKYSFNDLSVKINSQVFILAGKKEIPGLIERAKDAHKRIPKSKLLLIENTGHDIGSAEYREALKEVISQL